MKFKRMFLFLVRPLLFLSDNTCGDLATLITKTLRLPTVPPFNADEQSLFVTSIAVRILLYTVEHRSSL